MTPSIWHNSRNAGLFGLGLAASTADAAASADDDDDDDDDDKNDDDAFKVDASTGGSS